jgi:hypothetical protein
MGKLALVNGNLSTSTQNSADVERIDSVNDFVSPGIFGKYKLSQEQTSLRLRGGGGTHGIELSDRKVDLENIEPSEAAEQIVSTSKLWDDVPANVAAMLGNPPSGYTGSATAKQFSFFSHGTGTGLGPTDIVKFSFFQKELTLAEAKNMALFAILKTFQENTELFLSADGHIAGHITDSLTTTLFEKLFLCIFGGDDNINVETLLAVMQFITRIGNPNNSAPINDILRMLNCDEEDSEKWTSGTFAAFQNFIVDEFKVSNCDWQGKNITLFLEIFCGYYIDKICVDPSYYGESIDETFGSTRAFEDNLDDFGISDVSFAGNMKTARAFYRVIKGMAEKAEDTKNSDSGVINGIKFPKIIISAKQRFSNVFSVLPGVRKPFFFTGTSHSDFLANSPMILNVDAIFESDDQAIETALRSIAFHNAFQSTQPESSSISNYQSKMEKGSDIYDTVKQQIPFHARNDWADFVATVFAGRVMGTEYGNEIIEIYEDLGGIELSNFEELKILILNFFIPKP